MFMHLASHWIICDCKLKVSSVSVHIKSSADYTYYRKVISFGDFSVSWKKCFAYKYCEKSASSFTFTGRDKVQLHEGL